MKVVATKTVKPTITVVTSGDSTFTCASGTCHCSS